MASLAQHWNLGQAGLVSVYFFLQFVCDYYCCLSSLKHNMFAQLSLRNERIVLFVMLWHWSFVGGTDLYWPSLFSCLQPTKKFHYCLTSPVFRTMWFESGLGLDIRLGFWGHKLDTIMGLYFPLPSHKPLFATLLRFGEVADGQIYEIANARAV